MTAYDEALLDRTLADARAIYDPARGLQYLQWMELAVKIARIRIALGERRARAKAAAAGPPRCLNCGDATTFSTANDFRRESLRWCVRCIAAFRHRFKDPTHFEAAYQAVLRNQRARRRGIAERPGNRGS